MVRFQRRIQDRDQTRIKAAKMPTAEEYAEDVVKALDHYLDVRAHAYTDREDARQILVRQIRFALLGLRCSAQPWSAATQNRPP